MYDPIIAVLIIAGGVFVGASLNSVFNRGLDAIRNAKSERRYEKEENKNRFERLHDDQASIWEAIHEIKDLIPEKDQP